VKYSVVSSMEQSTERLVVMVSLIAVVLGVVGYAILYASSLVPTARPTVELSTAQKPASVRVVNPLNERLLADVRVSDPSGSSVLAVGRYTIESKSTTVIPLSGNSYESNTTIIYKPGGTVVMPPYTYVVDAVFDVHDFIPPCYEPYDMMYCDMQRDMYWASYSIKVVMKSGNYIIVGYVRSGHQWIDIWGNLNIEYSELNEDYVMVPYDELFPAIALKRVYVSYPNTLTVYWIDNLNNLRVSNYTIPEIDSEIDRVEIYILAYNDGIEGNVTLTYYYSTLPGYVMNYDFPQIGSYVITVVLYKENGEKVLEQTYGAFVS